MPDPTAEQLIVERLRRVPEVERIYLFGSRARGDNAPRADIDIAVACPTADRQQWLTIGELVEETDTLLEIDLVRLEDAPADLKARSCARESCSMSDPRLSQSLANLRRALDRLGEALAESPANALIVDGTIQRFEFAIELTWKTMRRALAVEGIETSTHRSTLKQAFAAGWLQDEAEWLQMLRDRSETSHIYNEQMARQIYARIRQHHPVMEAAYAILAAKAG